MNTIHYIFRSVDRTELIAPYRAADVALITPAKTLSAAILDHNEEKTSLKRCEVDRTISLNHVSQ